MAKKPGESAMKRQFDEDPTENVDDSLLRERLTNILSDALGNPDLPVELTFGSRRIVVRIERGTDNIVGHLQQLTKSIKGMQRAIAIARVGEVNNRLGEFEMDAALAGVELISNFAAELAKSLPNG